MSYIRRLPSGKWQATVRGPDGRKHTKTDALKKVVKTWATERESRFAQGELRDPRAGDVRVVDWHKRYAAAERRGGNHGGQERVFVVGALRAEMGNVAHVRRDADGGSGVGRRLRSTRRARHQGRPAEGDAAPTLSAATIADVVHIMSALYRSAMREHPPIVLNNPFADLELPRIEPRPVEFYERRRGARAVRGRWRPRSEVADDDRAGHASRPAAR